MVVVMSGMAEPPGKNVVDRLTRPVCLRAGGAARGRGLNLEGPGGPNFAWDPWAGLGVADAQPEGDRLGARVHADLLVDAGEVVLHRLVGDDQLLGDLAVGV